MSDSSIIDRINSILVVWIGSMNVANPIHVNLPWHRQQSKFWGRAKVMFHVNSRWLLRWDSLSIEPVDHFRSWSQIFRFSDISILTKTNLSQGESRYSCSSWAFSCFQRRRAESVLSCIPQRLSLPIHEKDRSLWACSRKGWTSAFLRYRDYSHVGLFVILIMTRQWVSIIIS